MEFIQILIIEDNRDLAFSLSRFLKKEKYRVLTADSGENGLALCLQERVDLVLLDLRLPGIQGLEVLEKIKEIDPDLLVIMMTASTDIKPAIEAMRKGAFDYLIKPFELDEFKILVQKALETHQLKREVAAYRREHQYEVPHDTILGESPKIEEIRNLIRIVAETAKTSVLVEGESGTGKELVANAIHALSGRSTQPFVTINCSAIPDNLLESELFGHEKGAFTDAKTMKKGLFELANGGTLFLDEISSMKLSLQPKILRVIESQTLRRIGGVQDVKIDVRVIAATNVNLAELVQKKEFRDDLFYRLKVMEIVISPLRERKEDIILIAKVFLQDFNREFNRKIVKFDSQTEKLLLEYSWPGNIRELKNVIERGVILCKGEILTPEFLPLEIHRDAMAPAPVPAMESGENGEPFSLEDMERQYILKVLKEVHQNKSKASRILNISRSTLREKLKHYKIE